MRVFVAESIAFAYRSGPADLRTEKDPLYLDAPSAVAPVISAVADLESQVAGSGTGVYNVVDDEPATVSEWLPEVARLIGAKPPRHVPAVLARLIGGPYAQCLVTDMPGASNRRARDELGWTPEHPSWRTGFASALRRSRNG